jgi:hypothetical protein
MMRTGVTGVYCSCGGNNPGTTLCSAGLAAMCYAVQCQRCTLYPAALSPPLWALHMPLHAMCTPSGVLVLLVHVSVLLPSQFAALFTPPCVCVPVPACFASLCFVCFPCLRLPGKGGERSGYTQLCLCLCLSVLSVNLRHVCSSAMTCCECPRWQQQSPQFLL